MRLPWCRARSKKRLDGCSSLGMLRQVVMFAGAAGCRHDRQFAFSARGTNSFAALIYLADTEKSSRCRCLATRATIPACSAARTGWMAGRRDCRDDLPCLSVFIVLQRYYIWLLGGAVKS